MSSKLDKLTELYTFFEGVTRREVDFGVAKFVHGDGSVDADVIFIGEAPGLDEDRQGRPFIGRAGKALSNFLISAGLVREKVYITNTVKYHPMKNPATPDVRGNDRPPTPREIACCLPILIGEISIIRPRFIVTLGSPATRTVLATEKAIGALRGRLHSFPVNDFLEQSKKEFPDSPLSAPSQEDRETLSNVQVFPAYHPAAMFHNPKLRTVMESDMTELGRLLKENNAVTHQPSPL